VDPRKLGNELSVDAVIEGNFSKYNDQLHEPMHWQGKKKAEQMLDQLLRMSINTYVPPFHLAGICVGLKENDCAFEWLEKAYQQRSDQITYIAKDPRFDSLRSDPRFSDLVRRIGL
jgi:hypothetical protein